jgi:hypothetical protein
MGATACSGSCVDTSSDAKNCGACGVICAAAQACIAGACACSNGGTLCSGSCVDTLSDGNNCGACGAVCAGGQTCQGGACACPSGSMFCGGACINTQSDSSNCGACGNVCALGQTCVSGACSCGASNVSFSAQVQPIFTASCASAGCHGGMMPAQGLSLSAGVSYSKLVNVISSQCADGRKRVLPGQPSMSYLIDKMMGVDLCAGTVMPKMGPVPSADIQTISNWICQGAPNN